MKKLHYLSLASLFTIALFAYISVSLMALQHLLVIIPGSYFLYRAIKNKDFKLSASSWCLVALIAIAIISNLLNWNLLQNGHAYHFFKLKYFLIALLGIFAYQALAQSEILTPGRIKLLLKILLVSTTLAGLSGLIAYKWGFNPLKMKAGCHPDRTCGMFGMYMTYAYSTQFFILLVIGLIFKMKNKVFPPFLLWAILLINSLGFFLSFARGPLVGLLAALPFFWARKSAKVFTLV
ncbi:MAG: hypothetical protein WCG27_13270, partial [Pseudomonadota bacterium]